MQQTRPWYVLTGGPCAGKTTTINELSKRGYPVTLEGARVVIEEGFAAGKTLDEIRTDPMWFENVVHKQETIENAMPQDQVVFLDRGIPDSVAYFREYGQTIEGVLSEAIQRANYRKVFVLDCVDFKNDGARTETPEEARRLGVALEKGYRDYGYEVVRVPVMSVKDRIEFILANLD